MYKVAINNTQVGSLFIDKIKNKNIISFSYNPSFLNSKDFFNIDPNLSLSIGRQYSQPKSLFGFLEDCSPDRWGRMLLKRKFGRSLSDIDFVLNVDDFSRMGAIRFFSEDGCIIGKNLNIPTIKYLSQLYESSKNLDNADADIEMLFAPGSSLGGARPKSGVVDNNQLKLAKFPKNEDEYNVEAWEATLLTLAKKVGINVVQSQLINTSLSGHSILLIDRFDRRNTERIPYVSAMTALDCSDGDNHGSYLELSEFIAINGSLNDSRELWKRMVFNMITHNFDDHLRNHGFLMINNEWRLSPAFDINPNTDKQQHAISINGYSYDPDIKLALELSESFYLNTKEAETWLKKCEEVVANEIKPVAQSFGIKLTEIKQMMIFLNKNNVSAQRVQVELQLNNPSF